MKKNKMLGFAGICNVAGERHVHRAKRLDVLISLVGEAGVEPATSSV
jgi:hypothetical protein